RTGVLQKGGRANPLYFDWRKSIAAACIPCLGSEVLRGIFWKVVALADKQERRSVCVVEVFPDVWAHHWVLFIEVHFRVGVEALLIANDSTSASSPQISKNTTCEFYQNEIFRSLSQCSSKPRLKPREFETYPRSEERRV